MTTAIRIIHWVTVICVVAAVVTGLYIADPYYQSFIADPAVDKYVMAWNRWIHFIGAIILDVASIVVAYLYFFSRFDRPWKKVVPTSHNIKEFWEVIVNLMTLNRTKNFDSAHSDSFNTVYFAIFHLLLAFMLFSGLQLYVHGLGSGESSIGAWWPWLLHAVTDWTLWVFGDKMGVRIAHHLTMWWILVWAMFHIYYQVWRTIYWQEGDIAIVFGGTKFKKKSDQ
jgi:Ni/Fe-hydrogenase 1 B-type cytochrome subunit